MAKLLKDQEAVNEVRGIVSVEEEKMRADTDLVHRYTLEAEKDLNDVMPLLSAATESLYTLKKADISEIR
jgi:dynein heavy chain